MQTEMQRLQDPSQVNGDNPDSVRRKSKRGERGGERIFSKRRLMCSKQTLRMWRMNTYNAINVLQTDYCVNKLHGVLVQHGK
jgi:hypothetical protein